MATRKQIAANRRNAKKSAGPKTIAGKILSSRNSVKYGLLCRDIFRFPCEDAEAFALMRARLFDDLQPQGVRERFLVEHIFGLMWRLRRAAVAEAGVLLHRVRDLKGLGPKPYAKLIPQLADLPDDSGRETANEFCLEPQSVWRQAPPPRPSITDVGQAHIIDVQEGDTLSKVRRHETSLENSLLRVLVSWSASRKSASPPCRVRLQRTRTSRHPKTLTTLVRTGRRHSIPGLTARCRRMWRAPGPFLLALDLPMARASRLNRCAGPYISARSV